MIKRHNNRYVITIHTSRQSLALRNSVRIWNLMNPTRREHPVKFIIWRVCGPLNKLIKISLSRTWVTEQSYLLKRNPN